MNNNSFIKNMIDNYAIGFEEIYTDNVEYRIDVLLSKVDEFKNMNFEKSNSRLNAVEIE